MTAALVAAVVVLVGLVLPPARLSLEGGDDAIPGAFHVHTNRSDGRGSPDEVAAAAARAGLRFLVFTDHGNGTRAPDPPTYRSGVLCLDGVEISTDDGHLIALGLPVAPYPLAGEGRDVLEDVHRLGGIGVAAHPDSPRTALQWRDWEVPLDGLELVNLETEWRRQVAIGGFRMATRVARSLSTYLIRPSETMAALVTGGDELAPRWTALAGKRHIAMFAGVDAHAHLDVGGGDRSDNRWGLAFPGYEAIFRTLTMRVRPTRPLTGDALSDGAQLLDALKKGRSYAALEGAASPPAFELTASVNGAELLPGDDAAAVGPVRLTLRTNAPASFTTTIWRNGAVFHQEPASPELTVEAAEGEGLYRAEIRAVDRPGAPPWVLSNAVVLRSVVRGETALSTRGSGGAITPLRTAPGGPPGAKANPFRILFDARHDIGWLTELSRDSKVAMDVVSASGGRELHARFGLPGGDVSGHFVAIVADLGAGGLGAAKQLRFTARSGAPMRLSVQLRVPNSGDALRWRRSVYIDADSRPFDLAFDDFRPVERSTPHEPTLTDVRALLFVVDQTNTSPGTSGHFWLRDVGLF